jgi:predicted nuclease of predicted toxin-antitoxin system
VRPRFQADYDLNCDIVSGVLRREPSIDFQTGHEAGFEGLDDPEILSQAARAGRILITHDQKTMPKHFADFVVRHASPGVLIVPQSVEVRSAIEDLLLIWAASDAEQWQNVLDYLPL